MAALAARVPRLQRLHLDTWPSPLGAKASQIPKLFPNLKSLRIRHEHIPEKNFLDLHQLQDLELLEVVDSHPDLPALVRRLRILTKYRLRVLTPPYQRDALSCLCVLDHQQDQRSELARRCSGRETGVKLVPLVPFI
ncbi:unnamed protein product [Tetraodon nigroviridis]|uniref:(spotted green pufferfish) hypothetical protein n=1 Tax=Tetraodon nigroviridis TaxID=99883 RepID=Q4SBV6_TETNG|nr:unnamed protein product [Tetraodon nigroviridis]